METTVWITNVAMIGSSDEGNEELLSENLEEALELSDDSDCST